MSRTLTLPLVLTLIYRGTGYCEEDVLDGDQIADKIGDRIVDNLIEQYGLEKVMAMMDAHGDIEECIDALINANPMMDKYFWAYYKQDRCCGPSAPAMRTVHFMPHSHDPLARPQRLCTRGHHVSCPAGGKGLHADLPGR